MKKKTAILLLLCLLFPLFSSMDPFFGSLLLGAVMGVMLALLLPLAGATRLREPFAWLDRVRSAGSIFLGHNAPEALGDYLASYPGFLGAGCAEGRKTGSVLP